MVKSLSDLSPGGQMILRRLAVRTGAALSRLGPLRASVAALETHRLVERFAPGEAIAKTSIRLTPAGRALLKKEGIHVYH